MLNIILKLSGCVPERIINTPSVWTFKPSSDLKSSDRSSSGEELLKPSDDDSMIQ